MKKNTIHWFRFKNTMLIANMISNFIGVAVVLTLASRVGMLNLHIESRVYEPLNRIFIPLSFVLPIIVTLIYERPIRKYLDMAHAGRDASEDFTRQVHRRLLNEPFFLITLDALVWISAATAYALYFWGMGMGRDTVLRAFWLNLQVGIISVTIAFFVLELFLQRRLAPYFFPHGGLSAVKGAKHIRIRTRMIVFLTATNLIPLWAMVRGIWDISQSMTDPVIALLTIQEMILIYAVIFTWVGGWLTILVSGNLTRPLRAITAVLQRIKEGHFEQRVEVTSNDELGYVGDAVNEMAGGLEEREFIKETFGKYVSREVRDEVLSRRIPLDGEVREVSVLFADLRNFTPFVESTTPQQVVRIINRYFEEMEGAILSQGGLILQYIGDEIEAVFGAPLPLDDHPTKALAAAMEMNLGLDRVNRILSGKGYPPLQHGIGIHSGKVVAANIGSPSRLSYALVGDTVNIASRLQDANKRHGTSIIVSAETFHRLSREFPLRNLPGTALKGKKKRVEIFGL